MMRRRPSIYHGSTLRQVQAEARRRHDERLMVEILSGLFYVQDDAQINGGSRCMSTQMAPAVECERQQRQTFTISTASKAPANTVGFQETERKERVAVNR